MEGAFVAAAIADVEGETLFVDVAYLIEALGFEKLGAAAQPLVLGHALDECIFGASHGAVLVSQIHEQIVIGVGTLAGQEKEVRVDVAETVAGSVVGGGGFALFRFGAGGMFGIDPVGCDLRFSRHDF
jgi:hypothetical protein